MIPVVLDRYLKLTLVDSSCVKSLKFQTGIFTLLIGI